MKKSFIIAGLLTIALTLAGITVAAGHGHFGGGHFGAHMHSAIGDLIRALNLSDEQHQHLDAIHHAMAERFHGRDGHEAHLRMMLQRVESGHMDPVEVRQSIDQHIEQMRQGAYAVSDEMVTLFNSLDDEQRRVLEEHLREALSDDGHGHGKHGAWHGHHGHGDHSDHGSEDEK